MKRIGIIGTGRHGSRYARHIINDIRELELGGISRRSSLGEEQAREWNCGYHHDWRDLVKDSAIDAIIAVTPPGLNLDIARSCALQGKPLLMEKPLARDGDEAAQVINVMEEAGCSLTVGQTLRYNPVIAALKETLPELGELYSFTACQRLEPSTLGWHDQPEQAGAGVVMHTAVHVFDALRLVTERKINRVMARMRCVHSRILEDHMVIIAECEGGVCGTVDVSKVGGARSGRYEFICRDGQLTGEQIHGFLETVSKAGVEKERRFEPLPTIVPLLQDWSDFLQGKSGNPVTGEDGLYAVRVCSAALESAKRGEWVAV